MLRTNGERLKESLLQMAEIGATDGGGVSRLALTDEDRRGRDLFAAWARQAGLSVRVDDMGTQYARLEGADPEAAPVLIGSHLDTVPAGGKFDGALGVLAILEVVRTLGDAGVRLRRPIEAVNFTNEEGARFEPAMMASGVLAGRFTPEYVNRRQDRNGATFGAELERIGYRGSVANRPGKLHAFLEVHIEQGPVLEAEGLPLPAVSGILGMEWLNVTVTGQQQHAGPSPMRSRRDAMVAAARIVAGVQDLGLEYPEPVVTTVGRFQPIPGIINQIPGQVILSVDLRHPNEAGLDELGERTRNLIRHIASEERVAVAIESIWKIAPSLFDRDLVALMADMAGELGVPCRLITSGAGHDVRYINEIAPTAMLFVRTVGGKSHCETEAVDWDDCRLAADVLLHTVLRLTGSAGA